MAKVGDIAVELSADIGPLQRSLAQGTKSLNAFGDNAGSVGAKFTRMGAAVAASAAAIGVGLVAFARNAAASATEIQNLSRIAGVTAEEFQKLAIAAGTVGVSQEKLADIVKDVNDKFGDFMANGAGPLADFFDNIAPAVGVTAEQFARLSGPDALQLYVDSLQKAGLTQQQMTFYMEALASDATALLPILKDNGQALGEIGREAERTGRIISNDLVQSGADLDRKFQELSDTIRTQAVAAMLEYADEIEALLGWVYGVGIPALVDFADKFIWFADQVQPALTAMRAFRDFQRDTRQGSVIGKAVIDTFNTFFNPLGRVRDIANDLSGDAPPADAPPASTKITVTPPDPPPPRVPLTPPSKPGSSRSGGGGGSALSREDFDAFLASLAEEAEALEIWRQEQLEKLDEFRKAKLGTEAEYNALEQAIQKEHADKLAEIERAKNAERLAAIQGAFGDLASLMSTSNEKLFKIGKAAAIAEATVSGYQAAVDAWQKGMKIGGPPVAAAFTAASLARTGSLIAGIASQTIGGGGGKASAGGVGGGQGRAAPETRTVSEIRFMGSLGASGEQLVEIINEEYKRGNYVRAVVG